jgi:hypothetical protein
VAFGAACHGSETDGYHGAKDALEEEAREAAKEREENEKSRQVRGRRRGSPARRRWPDLAGFGRIWPDLTVAGLELEMFL